MARRKAKKAADPIVDPVVEVTPEISEKKSISDPSTGFSPSPVDGSETFVIAEGRALTGTLKGLLSAGDTVSADDLRDGQEGFERWQEAGFIVARKK